MILSVAILLSMVPLQGHPGNVFVRGESVSITLPESTADWKLVDYDGHTIGSVPGGSKAANLGQLGVGFYRLVRTEGDWVSLAVLEPLKAPTPKTSPICLDVAMSWFYGTDQKAAVASLCRLAGVARVRDRLAWQDVEPSRGEFAASTRYDESAKVQSDAGLQILQVNHSSPSWAGTDAKRFPTDLRDAFRFYREMARRWRGEVGAFEPWNEADIDPFGGHTGTEMAAMQKASYLGIKAGNPSATVCQNVFAAHNTKILGDFDDNQAWPYFDTYNLHHYEGLGGYRDLYADHRAVSAGRPVWVSECAIPVPWSGDAGRKELSDADLKEQSERIAKVYATSLFEGSAATFYFILGDYVEGGTQFGVIRRDLSPRPAYVAIAAVGRLLADAKPLGRLGESAYAFRAKPDGVERTVVVGWASDAKLPVRPLVAYDHLGREIAKASFRGAPVFAVLPVDARLELTRPPKRPAIRRGVPSTVVLQSVWRREDTILPQSAYAISASGETTIPVNAYNFGKAAVRGSLRVGGPDGWAVRLAPSTKIDPMGKVDLKLTVDPKGNAAGQSIGRVVVTGGFGPSGVPVLSLRLAPSGGTLATGVPVAGAVDPAKWATMTSGGPITVAADGDGVIVDSQPQGDDRWVFPHVPVVRVPRGAVGLALSVTLLEGAGQLRVILDEKNGSSYVCDFYRQPKVGETVDTATYFDSAVHGDGWSKDDPDRRLDLDQVVALKIGFNTRSSRLRYRIAKLRWIVGRKG